MKTLHGAAMAFGVLASAIVFAEVPADDYASLIEAARTAMAAEEHDRLIDLLDRAQRLRPGSSNLWVNRVLARELAGRTTDAVALLEDFAGRGLWLPLDGHPALAALAGRPEAADVLRRMQANLQPRGEASVYFELAETDLLPEAIALDGQTLLIGSVRSGRILAWSDERAVRDLARLPGGVYDLELREDRIWAAFSNQAPYRKAAEADTDDPPAPIAGIRVLEPTTGQIIEQVTLAGSAVFGDLEVGPDGTAWVSDSVTPRILRWQPGTDALRVAFEDPRFVNLQGLALDAARHRLFVADYLGGLFRIDLDTSTIHRLTSGDDQFLGGIDGLLLAGETTLIGIQNGTTPRRILCLKLNAEVDRIDSLHVIQQALPEWNEPTHGAWLDGVLTYIATSNWPSYDADFEPRDDAPPHPLRVLQVEVDDACIVGPEGGQST